VCLDMLSKVDSLAPINGHACGHVCNFAVVVVECSALLVWLRKGQLLRLFLFLHTVPTSDLIAADIAASKSLSWA
jgi:hypothetical protein